MNSRIKIKKNSIKKKKKNKKEKSFKHNIHNTKFRYLLQYYIYYLYFIFLNPFFFFFVKIQKRFSIKIITNQFIKKIFI